MTRRRLPPGGLDPSFGAGGVVTTNFIEVTNTPGWSDSASSGALQSDGKIVVVGTTQPNGGPRGAISRYNVDGSLDTTFHVDGKVSDSGFSAIRDVKIQADGKIVVAGRSPGPGNIGNFALGRYNADGSPDAAFGTGGRVTTNPGVYDNAYAVTLLSDGRIMVAGQSGQPGPEQPYGFTLQKFNSDGTVDTSFGNSGLVRTFYSTAEVGPGYANRGNVAARDMVVQPDGKIVVAGYSVNGNYNGVTVVRYNPDGSRDSSFDGDGRVYTSLGTGRHFVTSVALQADGKLVAAGYFGSSASSDNDLAVVRYNTDGSLDTSFDGDGMLTVDYGSTQDVGSDVTIQSDGKLVVTGRTGNAVLVARLNSDGTPDTTFGSGGSLTTSIQASASGSSVVVQPDGNIVVAGTANNGNGNQFLNRDFAVVRYGVSLSTEEDTSALFSGLLVSDVDAGSSELSVSLSVGDGALALLSSNGLSFTDSDGSDGTLAFTGTQTDINAALAALEYTGNLNFHGQDTLQITVNDQGHTGTDPGLSGGATSEEATMTVAITVTPINDAPTVTAGGTLGYVENDAATVVDATLTLADVDDVNLESATVAITGGFQSSEDSLGFTDQNGITGSYSAATGVLTLSGTATVADYQAALAPVTYFNSSEDPDETNRTVSFTVNDGDVDSLAATSTVTVEAVDDLISIAHANDANETGSAVGKFTVTQSEIRATNTVITYSVLASSTASAAGTDYGTLSGTVTIMAGDITADIDVTGISDDLIVESDETINVQLTGTTTPSFIIDTANDTATVTILDHDSATLSIGDASVTEGHSGTTTLSFPVTLSREVDVDVLVDYTTQDGTATTADGDYVAQTGTLTINRAGDIAGTIDIAINGDTSIELDETLSLILSNLQANGRDVVLVDAPTAGAGIVQFDASSLGLANGNVVSNWGGQTAGGTPTYLAGQTPNGGAAVQFNGSDRFGDNIIVPASAAGDFIYVAVVKANNTGGYHNLVDDDIGVRPMLWIDPSFNYELNYSGGVGAKAVGTGTDGWDTATATNGNNNCFAAEEL